MLTHPIIDQLTTLKMTGMAEALREQLQEASSQELPFETRLSLLVDREHSARTNRALNTRLRMAKLHISHATMVDIDYHCARKLDKHHIATLATGKWLEQKHNILITGATGTGKSYLACALAHKACLLGYKARYWRLTRLLEELDLAKADGRYLNLIKHLAKFHVLVLDDWAMTKLQGQHQQILLDLLDDRYQKAATLFTSQLPTDKWYEQITDRTFADAIVDRIMGQAQVITLSGPSLRKKRDDTHDLI